MYRLVEVFYEEVKGLWEERFERVYGFWRGFVDGVVNRYLDCGLFEAGFARVYCDECHDEFLVALSCKGRGFCPSCSAKRAAIFAAFLREEVLEPVSHAQWVFSIPKMLRSYFLYHPELLGKLCRATYETVQELMAKATIGAEGFRTGMVVVVKTAGYLLNHHPHTHAIALRGDWDVNGEWVPIPYVDTEAAERLFRHKVLTFLKAEGLLSEERLELLLSWNHYTGFSAHNAVTVAEGDGEGRREAIGTDVSTGGGTHGVEAVGGGRSPAGTAELPKVRGTGGEHRAQHQKTEEQSLRSLYVQHSFSCRTSSANRTIRWYPVVPTEGLKR